MREDVLTYAHVHVPWYVEAERYTLGSAAPYTMRQTCRSVHRCEVCVGCRALGLRDKLVDGTVQKVKGQ